MKFHLVEKSTRRASLFMMLFYILLVVLLAVFIYTLSGECPVKYMLGVGGAGYVILIWVFLGFVAGIFALIFSFAHVFVDEQGVRVSSGKLKIRNYSWEDVKRIEFCEIQCRNGAFPVVLISKKDQNNSVSRYNILGRMFTRNYFVFLFQWEAVQLLFKYARCPCHGLEVADKYEGATID